MLFEKEGGIAQLMTLSPPHGASLSTVRCIIQNSYLSHIKTNATYQECCCPRTPHVSRWFILSNREILKSKAGYPNTVRQAHCFKWLYFLSNCYFQREDLSIRLVRYWRWLYYIPPYLQNLLNCNRLMISMLNVFEKLIPFPRPRF